MIQRHIDRQVVRFAPCCMSVMCTAMALVISVSSTVATAQDDLRPPKADTALSGPKIITIAVAVLLTVGVVFVATRKAKRTHQD